MRTPFIDDDGRLFGRVNLIDAAVIVVVVLLIPLGYAAYLLFRSPIPTIVAVEPATVPAGAESRVTLRGTDLQPFLRAIVGTREAPLLVESPTNAEVKLPQLDPGTYDLALYDESQELVRAPSILTVVAPAAPAPQLADVWVTGMFVGLDKAQASSLSTAVSFGSGPQDRWGRILSLGRPEPDVVPLKVASGQINASVTSGFKVDALLQIRCLISGDTCGAGGTTLLAGSVISMPSEQGILRFRIAEVVPSDVVPVEITTLCATPPELLAIVRKDLATSGSPSPFQEVRARLIGLGEARNEQLQFGLASHVWSQPGVVFSARFRVPARRTPAGWEYDGVPLRAGERFTYSTPTYTLVTMIVDIRQPQAGKTPATTE